MCSLQHSHCTLTEGLGVTEPWWDSGVRSALGTAAAPWVRPGEDPWSRARCWAGVGAAGKQRGCSSCALVLAEAALPCLGGQEQLFPVSSLAWAGSGGCPQQ